MTLLELLSIKLGKRLAKLLAQRFLGDWKGFGEDLTDLLGGKIENYVDQQDLKRQFESIGERITEQLLPIFERPRQANLSVEAVVAELAEALNGRVAATALIKGDLDPAKIVSEIKRAHPLPAGQFSEPEEALYHRSLEESVRYLVDLASKLPHFNVSAVAESLRRLSQLREKVEETAERIRRIEDWVKVHPEDTDFQQYEVTYRLNIVRTLDSLELFGADLNTAESRRQTLSVAYVSLNLELPERQTESTSYPVETVLDSLRPGLGRLLVRGEAGSGKSTLFKWIAIQAARGLPMDHLSGKLSGWQGTSLHEEAEYLQFNWRGDIPILILLRNCEGGKLPSPAELPYMIAKWIGSPPEDWVLSILKEGRALLLLDGVDELANLHRETVRKEITDIISAYPLNYYIISTRPLAVPHGWLAHLGFRETRINPMSDLDRDNFVDKWHEAVEYELRLRGSTDPELPRLAAELKAQLPRNPIGRLATYPLLCAMVCALHRDRARKLPESQAELCEALCYMLLHRREREGGLILKDFPEPYTRLRYEQKRAIVQELAHFMVLNGESSISIAVAQEKVNSSLRFLTDQSPEDAGVILQSLIERSGVLREVRPDYMDFIHNTFKEFLAGEHFADLGNAGLLAEHAMDPNWSRVIQFAMATRRRMFATEVISRLLETLSSSAETLSQEAQRNCLFLALQSRAAALYISPELEQRLDIIAESLFPPANMTDAEALVSAGNVTVKYLRCKTDFDPNEAAACVRALRLLGTTEARSALETYLKDNRLPVISELALAMNPLLIPMVREYIDRGETIPEGIAAQINDITPIKEMTAIPRLNLAGTRVADIAILHDFRNLKVLNLAATAVKELLPIAERGALETLIISQTGITDLAPLRGLKALKLIDLSFTPVEDLSPIQGLLDLRSVNIEGTPALEHIFRQSHRILARPDIPSEETVGVLAFDPAPSPWDETNTVATWSIMVFDSTGSAQRTVVAIPGSDREAWIDFLNAANEVIEGRDDLHFFHWGPYVPTKLAEYSTRYPGGDYLADRMREALIDLLPVVQASAVLPLPILTLDLVAGYLGIGRRPGSQEAVKSRFYIAHKTDNIHMANRTRKAVEEYATDSLDTIEAIVSWLREGLPAVHAHQRRRRESVRGTKSLAYGDAEDSEGSTPGVGRRESAAVGGTMTSPYRKTGRRRKGSDRPIRGGGGRKRSG